MHLWIILILTFFISPDEHCAAKLSDCRLDTVEKYIGIKRDINIPGALVPHFYDTYLRTKNVGPLGGHS